MSPVRTATRSWRSKLSRVRSSRLVFPEPGELIRFRHRILCSAKRARKPAATRSFSLKTLRSSGTRSIFDLQIGEFEFVASQELGFCQATLRTGRIFSRRGVRLPADAALITARAEFNLECKRFQFCPAHESLKTKVHGVRINAREFADSNSDFVDVAIREAACFRANRIEHRICNSHFVHRTNLSRFSAIDRRKADRRSAMFPDAFEG